MTVTPHASGCSRWRGSANFAAGVGEQRQPGGGHLFPKAGVAPVAAIDVVAVGQELEHDRATGEAAVEFVERIGARGVDGDGGEKLRMPAREREDVVVRDVERAGVFQQRAVFRIDLLLREDDDRSERRAADQREQAVHVDFIEVRLRGVLRQAEVAEHEFREPPMPPAEAQPAAAAACAVADDVDVSVDRWHVVRGLKGSRHGVRATPFFNSR